MPDWLSFWNAKLREEQKALEPFTHIYIEYGEGLDIAEDDTIYCVGIEEGELRLFTRIEAGPVEPDTDPAHTASVAVWPKGGGSITADYALAVSPTITKALEYKLKGGAVQGVKRNQTGGIEPQAFRGRSSVRELAAGADLLKALWESHHP